MLVKLSAGLVNWLIRTTTCGGGAHDVLDAHLRSAPVIRCHPATDVALGDDADQFAVVGIFDDRRAAAS